MIKTTGTIQEIGETKTYPKKDGKGTVEITKLKIDGRYYTCFYSKESIEAMDIGDRVDVSYTEKENEFEGKTYINMNISSIEPHLDEGPAPAQAPAPTPAPAPATPTPVQAPAKAKGENLVNVGGKSFKVTIEEV